MPIIWQPIYGLSFLQRGHDAIRRAEEAVREGEFRLDLKSIRIVSPILHPGQVIRISRRVCDWNCNAVSSGNSNECYSV